MKCRYCDKPPTHIRKTWGPFQAMVTCADHLDVIWEWYSLESEEGKRILAVYTKLKLRGER